MKTTLALSCFFLAFALSNADVVQRHLRQADYETSKPDSPLDGFRALIHKAEKHENSRKLLNDDGQAIENFVSAIEKFAEKDGRFRRTEEQDATERHVDFLVGLMTGHEVIKAKKDD